MSSDLLVHAFRSRSGNEVGEITANSVQIDDQAIERRSSGILLLDANACN